MGLRLIRENSDTPNVTNKDDASMVRYAYGGYDGYISKRGSGLSSTINGAKFTINSGVINLQGWEVEIDSNGWSMTVTSANPGKQYYVVYCEVNLSLGGAAEIKSMYDAAGYPTVSAGDDLTATTNGTARLPLYRFTAQSGIISNVEKVINPIPYAKNEISERTESIRSDLTNGVLVPKQSSDAKTVNGLPIMEKADGLIYSDGSIIPQRIVLWEGNKLINTESNPDSRNVFLQKEWSPTGNDLLEFHITNDNGKKMVFQVWMRSTNAGNTSYPTTIAQIEMYSITFYSLIMQPYFQSGKFDHFVVGPIEEGQLLNKTINSVKSLEYNYYTIKTLSLTKIVLVKELR